MASILIAKGKLVVPFILCIYITSVTGTTTITTSCNGLVSEPLNITCTIDPYSSRTSITIPDGTSAGACSAPVPNIVCTQIAPYTTVHTNVGTENTFVVTIPSLDIGTHNGTWTCNHGSEMSTGEVCVNTLLSPQGKEPTFTAIHTSAKLITLSGEVYCQHPISAVTFKVLYAEQNGAYTSFNPQPSVSIQNLGSNGCGSHESNVSFNGILSCGNYTLAGKTFTLMARFTQSNLPPDSNTYNVTISGNFSCPDVETTTINNVETTTTNLGITTEGYFTTTTNSTNKSTQHHLSSSSSTSTNLITVTVQSTNNIDLSKKSYTTYIIIGSVGGSALLVLLCVVAVVLRRKFTSKSDSSQKTEQYHL